MKKLLFTIIMALGLTLSLTAQKDARTSYNNIHWYDVHWREITMGFVNDYGPYLFNVVGTGADRMEWRIRYNGNIVANGECYPLERIQYPYSERGNYDIEIKLIFKNGSEVMKYTSFYIDPEHM